MKPVIGVMPLWDDEKESLWMLPGYLDGIREAGGLPIMLPMTTDADEIQQLFELCDGLLFTGGHDVDASVYGEKALPGLVCPCPVRDNMEMQFLKLAVKEDKPVFGICRGIQFINAAMGGTLYQDLPTQYPSGIEHHMSAPYDREAHKVTIREESALGTLLQKATLGVNSYHHQAVKDLAAGFDVMAESEDGLIEAISMRNKKFIWAVQWHPEFSYKVDEDCRKLFETFVRASSPR